MTPEEWERAIERKVREAKLQLEQDILYGRPGGLLDAVKSACNQGRVLGEEDLMAALERVWDMVATEPMDRATFERIWGDDGNA